MKNEKLNFDQIAKQVKLLSEKEQNLIKGGLGIEQGERCCCQFEPGDACLPNG